ncbi:MAG: ABC transporter permease [Flavobacteriia bacterium]|nr:ABC transporter permease [Flavobacteriia bacterium]
MRNSLLIASRELKEKICSRPFILLSILGPLTILILIYFLFSIGGKTKKHWEVLVSDGRFILENKIMAQEDNSITYSFADGIIEIEEFEKAKKYQKFDALLEVNEKVLSNKSAFVFYREQPSLSMQTRIQYQFERRIEEILVKEFTKFNISEFRKIKQPISMSFRNVYDPKNEASNIEGWVGYFYGIIIFIFIFLFGMSILRSVSIEKSNRIVEVLLGSTTPNQLMIGKIIGIGCSALVQFLLWFIIIGVGLYFMREMLFPNLLEASNLNITQMTAEMQNQTYQEQFFVNKEYNQFVELVYERINFSSMTVYFLLFFIVGYFFYGTIFAAIGATSGSENDGQQFVLPLILLLLFALYSGYYVLENPNSELSLFFNYLPFTSPVVVMVKLAQGFEPGHVYEIFISLLLLIISSFLVLNIAGRLYSNGILQFGHRIKWSQFFKWMKKS